MLTIYKITWYKTSAKKPFTYHFSSGSKSIKIHYKNKKFIQEIINNFNATAFYVIAKNTNDYSFYDVPLSEVPSEYIQAITPEAQRFLIQAVFTDPSPSAL